MCIYDIYMMHIIFISYVKKKSCHVQSGAVHAVCLSKGPARVQPRSAGAVQAGCRLRKTHTYTPAHSATAPSPPVRASRRATICGSPWPYPTLFLKP